MLQKVKDVFLFKPEDYFKKQNGMEYFRISFSKNNNYTYYFDNEIISRGTWEKKKNVIFLMDTFFHNKYIIVVESDYKLVAIHLPLLYYDEVDLRVFYLKSIE